jgi:hypothetical protein
MANTQQYDDDVTATDIDQFGGQPQSAVDVAAAIDAIQDALASVGDDQLRVTAPNALDVSAATVETDLTSQTGRNLGKARLMDSSETLIDPATETTLSALADALASNAGDQLRVEQQTPIGVEDSTGSQVDPAENVDGTSTSSSTRSTGEENAATASVPDGRTNVTAAWDISGAATISIEVSPDGGGTWYTEHTAEPGSAESATFNFSTGFDDVRVYVDSNLNSASIGAKGA